MSRLSEMLAVVAAGLIASAPVAAQVAPATAPATAVPHVNVTAAASTLVANDRLSAQLRADAENASPAAAASEVNARVARALARAKAVPAIEAKTAGYSTWQVNDRGKPARWKVVQTIALSGSDFAALAGLVSRLQEDEGMLLTGLNFSVAADTRRQAEDGLTREAIRSWQQRAAIAAEALGYGAWKPARVTVQTGDVVQRPEPIARAMAMRADAPGGSAQVPVEAGSTEITVTITGDATLERPGAR